MNGRELQALAAEAQVRLAWRRHRVGVCTAAGCHSLGSGRVLEALARGVEEAGLAGEVEVQGTGCLGLCQAGPLVQVESRGEAGQARRCLYGGVDEARAGAIARGHLAGGAPLAEGRLPLEDPFFAGQRRVVLAGAGARDPERIETCLADGAYRALARVLEARRPEEVVAEVCASGLRGRGGGGYPTGQKWASVRAAPGARKVVVCNADEGDPGAFMDRSVLEGDPHRVLEGMAIAGYAVGADRGFVYVRGEYPLAVERLRVAVAQARALGLLGPDVLETGFAFEVELRLGAGAFVCGEETALIASLEGGRGTPRPRPPWTSERGAWGLPTLINNVETFANVPAVVLEGARAFAEVGRGPSRGTKVFALTGQVARTGLVEVPLGTTLREIVFGLGGGVRPGRTFKAAQTGGASGGCIPAAHLDLPVDYESLAAVGSFMGSGGLVVLDDTTCMVELAAFFMGFCREESCGQCVPCRAGTVQLHELLRRITRLEGTVADLERIEALCDLLQATSLCGLGQGAPGPVRSTLRHFRDEYLAHVRERRCPAGVCRPLPAAAIDAAPLRGEPGSDPTPLQGEPGSDPTPLRDEPRAHPSPPWGDGPGRMASEDPLAHHPSPRREDRASGESTSSTVTVTLDGRPLGARPRQTILSLCREHGIRLPTLCHLDGLAPVGACRLCLVEVAGAHRLQPACLLLAEEGLAVSTRSARLDRYRRQLVELLLAERCHACAACLASGRCELQALAAALEVDHLPLPARHPVTRLDASHPRFLHDPGRCVLCTRCVRACRDVEGASTWGVAGRGEGTRVVTDLDDPWGRAASCTGCGKCVQACPTGALLEKLERPGAPRRPELLAALVAARGRGGGP